MFDFLTNRRRKKMGEAPFPAEWEEIIRKNFAYYNLLEDAELARLRRSIQIFVAEKNWEGCGGLELTDDIRVTIAAQACLLILNLPHNYYENVETILVYPSDIVLPERRLAFFETATWPLETEHPIVGQALEQGPVILVWDAVLHNCRTAGSGFNVVYHEFAHKLDMLAGGADGLPPLQNRKEYRNWEKIFTSELRRLRRDIERGKKTFVDEYGAIDEAEFFAVATEQFFDQPLDMLRYAPELYGILRDYYRQDPARRTKKQETAH